MDRVWRIDLGLRPEIPVWMDYEAIDEGASVLPDGGTSASSAFHSNCFGYRGAEPKTENRLAGATGLRVDLSGNAACGS